MAEGSLFRHKVITLLRDAELLSQERIELLMSRRHTGFSAHNAVTVPPGTGEGSSLQHVPEPRLHQVRYYGDYSNVACARRAESAAGGQVAAELPRPRRLR